MTTQQNGALVPAWTLGDRLRKARTLTGLTVAEFAARIGVSDKTVNSAEGDKRAVRPITLNAWANETGVSREWLLTGLGNATPPDDGGYTSKAAELSRLTNRKRSAARHGGEGSTTRYPLAA